MDSEQVVYLGESKNMRARLQSHRRTYKAESLSASWVLMEGTLPLHLKERETDLIGALYKQTGQPPRFQYRG